jgi:hypothetical protein
VAPTGSLPPAQYQQKLDEELKYSACMRAHGIADFPDPNTRGLAAGKARLHARLTRGSHGARRFGADNGAVGAAG